MSADRNYLSLFFVMFTGLTGLFVVQNVRTPASKPTAAPPATSESSPKDQPPPPQRTLVHPLAEFLGVPVPANRDPTSAAKGTLKAQAEQEIGSLDFLIYLVADPLDSQANYRFDQQIDVLQKALATERFIPDRFYLPWKKDDKFRRHTQEPGVVLFRRNGPAQSSSGRSGNKVSDLLAVFLVGETTTAGIHTDAFQRAITHQHQLRELISGSNRISICGPVFSGSADSLARAIRRLPEEQRRTVNVITGQAVSIDQERFRGLSGDVQIFATVLPGDVLKDALIQHVVERNWNCSRIAWLTETGTGYGSSISFHGKGQDRQPAGDQAERLPEIIEFPFPANIAQVRAASEESRRRDSKTRDSLGGTPLRLTIPFAAGEGAMEMVPPLTPDFTAPSVELILGQILSTIRHQQIKYVGISATDPRDSLFIAAMIKEQCPNVQIMLVTSDVLHLHPEYSRIMHGALVSSCYPLYPEALTWCFPYGEHQPGMSLMSGGAESNSGDATSSNPNSKSPPHSRNSRNVVLPNQSMYGVYNALVMLRGIESGKYQWDGKSETVKLPSCADVPLPLCYSPPFDELPLGTKPTYRPAVWVSRIGSSNFHPITSKLLTDPEGNFAYTLKLEIANAKSIPRAHVHTRVPLSLVLLALAWILAALFQLAIHSRLVDVGKWARPLIIADSQPFELRSLAYVFRAIGSACLFVMLGLLGSITMSSFPGLELSIRGVIVVIECLLCYLLAILLAVALVRDVIAAFPRRPAEAPRGELAWHLLGARSAGALLIIAALAGYAIIALVQGFAWNFRAGDAWLWFSTAGDPWNGLSSLTTVQLPCLAVMILCYGLLIQLHFLSDDNAVGLPVAVTTPAERDLAKIRDTVLFPILARFQRGDAVILSILIVAAAFAWLGYLLRETQGPDFFAMPVNFPCILWVGAAGFWFLRFFKLIHILEDFSENLQKFASRRPSRWPTWQKMFEKAKVKKDGLEELFWTKNVYVTEVRSTLTNVRNPQVRCAREIDLYVRRMFFHFGRLLAGLIIAGCLLFLAAQNFPLSSEPLLRFTASAMLGAAGMLMVWYYIKFDRDELLSRLVGTDPKKIEWSWSMLNTVAPGVLLAAIACVSQVFPEVWQWLRYIAEPLARSSS
jgi:hypothetical protein